MIMILFFLRFSMLFYFFCVLFYVFRCFFFVSSKVFSMSFLRFWSLFYVPAIPRLRGFRGTVLGAPLRAFRVYQDHDLGVICDATGASDCKHNYDLHTYRRGALHSWPALLLYRHGSFWHSTPRWQQQFWRAPAGKTAYHLPRSRRGPPLARVGRFRCDVNFRSNPTFTRASPGLRS